MNRDYAHIDSYWRRFCPRPDCSRACYLVVAGTRRKPAVECIASDLPHRGFIRLYLPKSQVESSRVESSLLACEPHQYEIYDI